MRGEDRLSLCGPGCQLGTEPFHRQPDDVGVGTDDLLDNQFAFLLDRVGAGFIERIHPAEVSPDGHGVQGTKRNGGAFGEHGLVMLAQVQQAKGTVGKLLYDPQLYDESRANLAEAKKLVDNLNAGKGTAGKLLTDDEVYKQLSLVAQKVNTVIDKIDAGQGTIGQLMGVYLWQELSGV